MGTQYKAGDKTGRANGLGEEDVVVDVEVDGGEEVRAASSDRRWRGRVGMGLH